MGNLVYQTKDGQKKPVGRPKTPTEYTSPRISVYPISPSAQAEEPQALKTELVTIGQLRQDEGTLVWGSNDNEPLLILDAIAKSPTTTSCVGKIETYTRGEGFTDPELMKMPINADGDTLWDLHSAICQYYSSLDGFAVNFKYNRKGRIIGAFNMALDSCRLGALENTKKINCLKYNPYFGTALFNTSFTERYNLFDISKVDEQAGEYGSTWNGQAYFYGTKRTLYKHYPVPKFWSGKKWIYSDAKFATYIEKLLDNGFFESVLMKVIGDPNAPSNHPDAITYETGEDDVKRIVSQKTEGQMFDKMMGESFSGVEKAGKVMALWSLNKDQSVTLEAFPTNVNADLISGTLLEGIRMIAISTDVPAILANLPNSLSSLGSGGDAVKNAVDYMQSGTAYRRATLENFYNNILLANFDKKTEAKVSIKPFQPVGISVTVEDKFWEVLTDKEKKDFVKKNVAGMSEIIQEEPVTVDPETGEPLTVEETQVNEKLTNLTGRQQIQLNRITRQFSKGEISIEQAKLLLKQGFGFSDLDVNTWLGVQEPQPVTP